MASGFNAVTRVEVSHSTNAAWTDIDVSAYVPAGATGVVLNVVNNGASLKSIGFRKNGSTDTQTAQTSIHAYSTFFVGVDSSRIFECYAETATNIDVYLIGWIGSSGSFFTNRTDKTPGTTGSFQDVDISTDTGGDTAIAAFIEAENGTSAAFGFKSRINGGTFDPSEDSNLNRIGDQVVKCDGSEIFEVRIGSGITTANVWLIGYMTADITLVDTPTSDTPGSAGSYVDLTQRTGAVAGIYRSATSGFNSVFLRKNGETYEYYNTTNITQTEMEWVDHYDASGYVEAKLEGTTTTKIYYLGYFDEATSVPLFAMHHRKQNR